MSRNVGRLDYIFFRSFNRKSCALLILSWINQYTTTWAIEYGMNYFCGKSMNLGEELGAITSRLLES